MREQAGLNLPASKEKICRILVQGENNEKK